MKSKIVLFFALLFGAMRAQTTGGIAECFVRVESSKISSPTDYTFQAYSATRVHVIGHAVISNEEIADAVKAMEIFSGRDPDPIPTQIYSTTPAVINAGMLMMGDTESPDGLRRRADWLEKLAKAREKRQADLGWARDVLKKWKAKLDAME